MTDTWQDIQAFKSKHASLKEKLARRKKERQEVVAGILLGEEKPGSPNVDSGASTSSPSLPSIKSEFSTLEQKPKVEDLKEEQLSTEKLAELEQKIILTLDEATLELPSQATDLQRQAGLNHFPLSAIRDILEKLSAQELIQIKKEPSDELSYSVVIELIDHAKVSAVTETFQADHDSQDKGKRKRDEKDDGGHIEKAIAKHPKREDLQKKDDMIESLLLTATAKERETQKVNDEILELLSKPTAKEQSLVEKFKSQKGVTAVQEFCPHGTREECRRMGTAKTCDKLHFKKIIRKHTDESLGDCSFLNTCFHMDSCKYVHYEVDYPDVPIKPEYLEKGIVKREGDAITLTPPQWVQCDLRFFEFGLLGKFSVVMADPPWDIHMELPYGTMSDDEMRNLPVPIIQDEGYIFLWVTGRAMELGRECLKLWGYERVDELIWVKTNQLQRIIRTGRTGHWLNHGKEHCLIGVKGNPKNMNKGLDCDVIVAEVRATSHKPDEVYGMIERLSPGTRKIELFGRPHNVQPNWVTLGNQVDGVKLLDTNVVNAFKEKYPNPKMAMLPPDKAKKFYETGIID